MESLAIFLKSARKQRPVVAHPFLADDLLIFEDGHIKIHGFLCLVIEP